MRKLPLLSSEVIIKKLKKAGFTDAPFQGKGSHSALYKVRDDGRKLLVIIPKNNPVPRGTLISIIKQADLTKEEFNVL
ncbi:addiction module toxin, HicA family [Methanocalculus taiwanensis]|uniref:Addiction module toxin, HicA family n=1 Tax=Methanocalculus taiwanensis TaxID=106207 RepID=A0ABD4THH0_9EURY|nr:type II toxin-antitoxin system HicA family toxin [Methanocalculus taiwanensis]MCQ1538161.1 addiction module toxin, HicA family [Methanocalculus taiwanensis]